jgi:flagellar biosynthesis protein FlhF
MELKRILANDTKSATDIAMKLYGRDVLVVSNHTVGAQTELVVALDVDEQSIETSDQHSSNRRELTQPAGNFRSQLVLAQAKSTSNSGAAASPPLGADFMQAIQERDDQKNQEIRKLIRDELAAFRAELSLSQKTSGWQSSLKLSPEVDDLLASLTQAGMPAGLRTLLLDTVKDMHCGQEALRAIREQLEQVVHLPHLALPQSGTHLIAGPSGVGKTLMAIRLASHAATQNVACKVALVSYRNNRAGAWEQTQALSSQAEVECFRADSSTELLTLLRGLGDYKLILIDTASTQLPERVAEIESVCPSCVKHALVAADSSSATLRRTLRASGIHWNSMMVSKLDESIQPWPLVEFLCDNFLSICAASDGAQVAALKLGLTSSSLIEMALAQLSRRPESQAPARSNQLDEPPAFKLPALAPLAPRLLTLFSPRGLRASFN